MAAIDKYDGFKSGKESPGDGWFEITPHDTNELAYMTRAICFVTEGDLKITDAFGNTVTLPSGLLSAGIMHPTRIVKVFSTGTTATDIWGVY